MCLGVWEGVCVGRCVCVCMRVCGCASVRVSQRVWLSVSECFLLSAGVAVKDACRIQGGGRDISKNKFSNPTLAEESQSSRD